MYCYPSVVIFEKIVHLNSHFLIETIFSKILAMGLYISALVLVALSFSLSQTQTFFFQPDYITSNKRPFIK